MIQVEDEIRSIRNDQDRCQTRQALRDALRSKILSHVRSGFSNADIRKKLGVSETALRMNLALLQTDGILLEIHECPVCGLRMASPDEDCLRCGIVKTKMKEKAVDNRGLWSKVRDILDEIWDRVDCGGYRLLMKLKARWK